MAGKIHAARAEGPHRRRREERTRPRLPTEATADPLEPFWSELEWFVTEDPEVVRALINLGELDMGGPYDRRTVRVTPAEAASPELPVILDVEGLLREIRARYPSPELFAATSHAASDPLRAYLEELDAREDEGLLIVSSR